MRTLRASLASIVVLLACACSQPQDVAPPPPDAEQPAAGQPAPPPEGGAAGQASAAIDKPAELMLGEWTLELTPSQQRQYELLKLAFRDPPPTQEEIAALELAPDEELMLGMVIMGREQHPDDQATPDVRRSLDELSSATLTITAETMRFAHGEEHDEASYTVQSQEGGSVQLETTTMVEGAPVVETVHVLLEGPERLLLWAEGEPASARQAFIRRRTAEGEPAPEAPPAPVPDAAPGE